MWRYLVTGTTDWLLKMLSCLYSVNIQHGLFWSKQLYFRKYSVAILFTLIFDFILFIHFYRSNLVYPSIQLNKLSNPCCRAATVLFPRKCYKKERALHSYLLGIQYILMNVNYRWIDEGWMNEWKHQANVFFMTSNIQHCIQLC